MVLSRRVKVLIARVCLQELDLWRPALWHWGLFGWVFGLERMGVLIKLHLKSSCLLSVPKHSIVGLLLWTRSSVWCERSSIPGGRWLMNFFFPLFLEELLDFFGAFFFFLSLLNLIGKKLGIPSLSHIILLGGSWCCCSILARVLELNFLYCFSCLLSCLWSSNTLNVSVFWYLYSQHLVCKYQYKILYFILKINK